MNINDILEKNMEDLSDQEVSWLHVWAKQFRIKAEPVSVPDEAPKKHGKLHDMRCYLCGAMSFTADNGMDWRQSIGMFLKEMGVKIIDPTDKPIDFGREDVEDASLIKKMLKEGDFDQLAENMKLIRATDLRSVDITDFQITNLDTSKYTAGSWEEITLANRQKKPIIVHVEQGKNCAPPWIFGMIPHQMIFSSWGKVMDYLMKIDNGRLESYDAKRWMFFKL
jgi:hypothetical protein